MVEEKKPGDTNPVVAEFDVGSAYLIERYRREQKLFQYEPNHPIKSTGRPLDQAEVEAASVGIWQHSEKLRGGR